MSLPGFTAAEVAAYERALRTHAGVATTVQMMDLSHHLIASVTPVSLDGQVNVSENDGVVRTLNMGFLDPDRALRLDGDVPSAGVAGMNRLIRVTQYVQVEELDRWLGVAVFTGRPSLLERDGDVVTVTAQSKECLHLHTVPGFTIRKGASVAGAIRYILAAAGETRFRIPSGIPDRLPTAIQVGGQDTEQQPWTVARRLAASLGMQLFYDNWGFVVLRQFPQDYAWTLVEHGEDANTLSRVRTSTDLTSIRNRVVVIGHTTEIKGRKGVPSRSSRPLVKVLHAPEDHPFSEQSLAVNGVPWIDAAYYDEPNLHTTSQVLRFGSAQLTRLLAESTHVQTTMVPIFHLDPMDLLQMRSATGTFGFRFRSGSIPLGASAEGMSVGWINTVRAASAGRARRSV